MNAPALFRQMPCLSESLPWLGIVPMPTPASKLDHLGKYWGHDGLFVKREDYTDTVYGGNKVRNLEFLLAEAVEQDADKLVTVAPLGSNFIAALAAQARKFQLRVEVKHFVPVRTPQIDAHWKFSSNQGAEIEIHDGITGTVPAGIAAAYSLARASMKEPRAKWIAPGGSNVTGALGHVNAALELYEQVAQGQVPHPDVIVVGAGTCGTIAGLTAAHRLLGKATKIIAVRCVDRIVCNRLSIARLTNRVLRRLGSEEKVRWNQITLIDPPKDKGYGHENPDASAVMDLFKGQEGLQLDTTYTSKVALTLQQLVSSGTLKGKQVLYWHTFSSKAVRQPLDGIEF